MTIEDVHVAVVEAVRYFGFGAPYTAPIEIAQITRDGTSAVFSAVFNDLRNSRFAVPIFSIDIDTTTYVTMPAICDYAIGRITAYFTDHS